MLLRASGQREDTPIDLTAVTAPDAEAGVPHGKWLERLTRLIAEWMDTWDRLYLIPEAGRLQSVA